MLKVRFQKFFVFAASNCALAELLRPQTLLPIPLTMDYRAGRRGASLEKAGGSGETMEVRHRPPREPGCEHAGPDDAARFYTFRPQGRAFGRIQFEISAAFTLSPTAEFSDVDKHLRAFAAFRKFNQPTDSI